MSESLPAHYHWSEFYDESEPIDLPEWWGVDPADPPDQPGVIEQFRSDVRYEHAYDRAIDAGLLTALAAAHERYLGSYGTDDVVDDRLGKLRARWFPRPPSTKGTGKNRPAIASAKRQEVMERDAYRCQRCGGHHDLVIDHIVPVTRGGTNDTGNLQVLCRTCNSEKGTKLLSELGW